MLSAPVTEASAVTDLSSCQLCGLHAHRTRVVPGFGNRNADIILIGEAPGAEENRRGLPFIGPAGRRLDALLERVGLARSELWLTNILHCRPPKNDIRAWPDAVLTCPDAWLNTEIQTVSPCVILVMGATAGARYLPGYSVSEMAGLQRVLPDGKIVVGSPHPSAALRSGGTWNKWDEMIYGSLKRVVELVKEGERCLR